ncbi:hypothetical protein AQUSIP_13360 [Aquicella siphonis]|uniref:Uncharacterized protein n=1 Tax=Aquicella siphonis TaxID=254247 RepID=A0A5E4PHG7_9COXI|nr:hypothetical protein [Aquicella siphonis]VVC76035.1 hypothetical protein AQUSIP_13360 [Aquicella siphonis]
MRYFKPYILLIIVLFIYISNAYSQAFYTPNIKIQAPKQNDVTQWDSKKPSIPGMLKICSHADYSLTLTPWIPFGMFYKLSDYYCGTNNTPDNRCYGNRQIATFFLISNLSIPKNECVIVSAHMQRNKPFDFNEHKSDILYPLLSGSEGWATAQIVSGFDK